MTTLNAVVVDTKPTTLGVGEVVKLTNAKGKVEYYVGNANGQVSKPISTVSKAVSDVNKQVKIAENIQITGLKTSQKIELAEIKQELTTKGLPAKDIKTILANETKSNTAEVKQLSGLFSTDGLQYANRDPATNAFVTSATKPVSGLRSILSYSDQTNSPTIQNNIKSANDEIAKFQMTYGISQDFVQTGKNTTQGLNPYAIYQAIDKGDKLVFDATTNTYKPTDALAAAKGDQSGLMSGTSISKASARALGLITNTGVSIGQKANVIDDGNGNYIVRSTAKDAQGNYIDPYGEQKPLVDTGEKDPSGNPIYTMEARDDSKHNKVGVTSIYIKQPDGSFTLAGNADTSYTYIPKANIGKMVAGVALATAASAFGMPWVASNLVGPMLGMTAAEATASSLVMGISGALVGGAVAGATGQNVLTGAALAGVGAAAYTALSQAAQTAGGWGNLLDQVKAGDMSSFTTAISDAKPIADAAIGNAGGIDNLASETATYTQDLANAGIDSSSGMVNNGNFGLNPETGLFDVPGAVNASGAFIPSGGSLFDQVGGLFGGNTLSDTIAGAGTAAGIGGLVDGASGLLSGGAGSLITAGLNAAGGILSSDQAKDAAQTSANAQIEAAKIAADAAKFRPVGVTTNFGSSKFGFDANGNLSSAGYTLSPELQAQQNQLMATAPGLLSQFTNSQATTAPMGQAANSMMSLGNQYLTTSPQAQAAKYMAEQQALLEPTNQRSLADLQARLQAQGRLGVATGATTDGMNAANPELEAYYNALNMQNRNLAANATQGGMDYAKFGSGMVGSGGDMLNGMYQTQANSYSPYNTALSGAQTIEGLGQNALTMGMNMGSTATAANAASGSLLAQGMNNAAQTMQPANAQSNWGTLLSGAGNALSQYTANNNNQQNQVNMMNAYLQGMGSPMNKWSNA